MGDAGESYRPRAYAFCDLLLDLVAAPGGMLGTDNVSETLLTYYFTRYVNGDLDVSCEGSLGSAASSPGGAFYPSIVKGASTGRCTTSVDYPPFTVTPGNVGVWQFDLASGTGVRATYLDSDPGHPLNGRFWVLTENDCNCFTMNGNAEWMDASLEDVL